MIKEKHTILKLEGLLFAVTAIVFMVLFYFNFISKYFLCISLLFFSGFLFAVNATLQQQKSKTVSKFNILLAFLLFASGAALLIYCYAIGYISF